MQKAYLIAALFLLLALGFIFWIQSHQPEPQGITPPLTGRSEYCLTCHAELPQISNAHPIDTFGCVTCHGGERFALDAELAHSTLIGERNPAALEASSQGCGGEQCHSGQPEEERDHIHRVRTSLQATYAGAIAQVRYAFGAQADLTPRQGVFPIQDDHVTTTTGKPSLASFNGTQETNPNLLTFMNNCLHCHLSAEPLEGLIYTRFTGCAACHTPSANEQLEGSFHKLTTAIPYTQCNTCHNRGNYHMADMKFYPRQDQAADRLHDYYQPIAQFVRCEWTLDCIDCHTRTEAMGDGDIQTHKKDIQYIQCRTCHGTTTDSPPQRQITDANDLALRLAFLNPVLDLHIGDTILETSKSEPLWNIRQNGDGRFTLIGKVTGQRFFIPMIKGSRCQQKDNEQESRYCHQCHAVER